MMETLADDHPRQMLVFSVAHDIDDVARRAMRNFVARLATSRDWMLGAPVFIDTIEWPDDDSHGDYSMEMLGGYLELYSAFPPWTVPREVDLQLFEKATALLDALEAFSRERSLNFDVQFNGEIIGYVENGRMDEGLSELFLGEWRRGLGLAS